MATREIPCAASSLLAGLVDGADVSLVEVARTRVSVHYATGVPTLPVVSVATSDAVRLPNSLVTDLLPDPAPPSTGIGASVGRGSFRSADRAWRVHRWWQPPRPRALPRPTVSRIAEAAPEVRLVGVPLPHATYDGLSAGSLLGAGPGLTPAGDDVLAGALVTAHATGDPRLACWRDETQRLLVPGRTTAVSHAMLHHALDGYATPELAAFLTALCLGGDLTRARSDLLAVGHTSGSALLGGVLHTLSTHHLEGAA